MEVRTMNKSARLMTISVATILVFILSLASPISVISVLADEAAPPPAEASTAEAPTADSSTTEEGAITEAPPVDESTTMEIAPTAEATTVQAAPTEEAIIESASEADSNVTELLTQLPEETKIVVSNENGEAVTLATQEAAKIIATGDPIWCRPAWQCPPRAWVDAPTPDQATVTTIPPNYPA
jgi:Na+-transporting methylmalonyl-CoA/oxaloacetate decarboxylase gamma subunit